MSEKRIEFTLDNQSYKFNVKNNQILENISKGNVKNTKILSLANSGSDFLLDLKYEILEDEIHLTYTIGNNYHFYESIKNELNDVEKCRLAMNLLDLYNLKNSNFVPVVHPNNIMFDVNLRPKVVHRGIKNSLYPEKFNEENILTQVKSFIATVLFDKYSFDKLYNGVVNSKFIRDKKVSTITNAKNIAELKQILEKYYQERVKEHREKNKTVPIKQMNTYKRGFWILGAVAVVLFGVTLYSILVKAPLENKLSASTTDYLSTNYDRVISDLDGVDIDKMPKSNQLMLAKSYINVENLNHEQKENLLSSLNLNSDNNYFKYWIYNGQGNFDKSLDTAKFIGDDQLVLYSYTKLYDSVSSDPKISGSKKQSLLNKYSKKIKSYSHKMKKEQKKNA